MKKGKYISLISLVGILVLSISCVFDYTASNSKGSNILEVMPKQLIETSTKSVNANKTVTWAADALFSFLAAPSRK